MGGVARSFFDPAINTDVNLYRHKRNDLTVKTNSTMYSESINTTPTNPTAKRPREQHFEHKADLIQLAVSVSVAHNPDVASAAALISVTRAVFASLPEHGQSSVVKMLQLQMQCVSEWLERRGLDSRELDAAILGIKRAGETLAYIDSLPD